MGIDPFNNWLCSGGAYTDYQQATYLNLYASVYPDFC